ncbi:MAG: 50S ribosomal protein L25 [Candidatus Vogelbacteria bacterium CG10_big_fil_rev_8_21_14_0_10_49_38]|uniref:Large ribosomal subunit protein bL25 n=1 Tax=Candidatus Vogelbacteria bacterium CG10_big_fil_rev_8_21_14_0_10_49_38 TaxID=1975043 RepID=A0A2H0RI11_9BACT|nr:MAG: hypothetical protein BK006_01545 [bacterium CG10_49_38]PIR46080.1 MAG: 50S ribosomal protein L25 [Candidatus Vogelbacteria bacterium CG10_big_fil_rev_8_21_14_0_10_49_38]
MLKLKAVLRDLLGKKVAARRAKGEIPGVVYGRQAETRSVFVSVVDFKKVFKEAGESTIIALDLADQTVDVLINEVQFDPISDEPIHVDFYLVRQDQEIEVDVPLVFEGMAPAVKELGGSLVKVLHELPISALPKNLPHDLKVDLSSLIEIDSQIMVKDLVLPAGVVSTLDPEEVVVLVAEATEEETTEAAPVDLLAIEVEKKGKKEEGAEAETES